MKYDLSLFQYMIDPTPMVIIETFSQLDSGGEHWWEWEPETIESLLDGNTEHRKGIIQACASLLYQCKAPNAQNTHWREADIFGALCVEFDGISASIEYFEKPTLSQMLYCWHVMKSVAPDMSLEDDVKEYVSLCATEHGIVYVPGMLDVNKMIASRLKMGEGFDNDLVYEIEDILISDKKRKDVLNSPDMSKPSHIQVLRISAAFDLFNQRVDLGNRQINSMKRN